MAHQKITNESGQTESEERRKEALGTIRIRREEGDPWIEVELLNRGSLWAHVTDGEQKFKVLWKDVHPNDKFDYQ